MDEGINFFVGLDVHRRAGQQGLRGGGAGTGWIRLVHCAAGRAQRKLPRSSDAACPEGFCG